MDTSTSGQGNPTDERAVAADHELLKEDLEEGLYKPDLELLDRFTGFSSELVRLASLGLGGLALFLQSSLKQGAELQAQVTGLQQQTQELQKQITNLPQQQQTAELQNFAADLQRHATGLKQLAANLQPSASSLAEKLAQGWFNLLLGVSALLFGVGIASGLLHRFYASDRLAYHIDAHRIAQSKASGLKEKIVKRDHRHALATSWLISSECAVAVGAFVAGVAFAIRFSIISTKWISALALAVLAVTVAIGIAGSRWWRTWRKLKKKEGNA